VIELDTERELNTRHGLHMNQKGKEQRAIKVTNEVKDILCVKKLYLIKLKWKEEEVIDGVEVRGVDGESKGKLPKQSQGNNELYTYIYIYIYKRDIKKTEHNESSSKRVCKVCAKRNYEFLWPDL